LQPILLFTYELANVFAAGAVAALLDLLVDELLEWVRQGDVHGGPAGIINPVGQILANSTSCQTMTFSTSYLWLSFVAAVNAKRPEIRRNLAETAQHGKPGNDWYLSRGISNSAGSRV
jgi:hypothetical protein